MTYGVKLFSTYSAMGKFNRRQIDYVFPQKIRFNISSKLPPDILYEMSNPIFCKIKKNISECSLLIFLSIMLSIY